MYFKISSNRVEVINSCKTIHYLNCAEKTQHNFNCTLENTGSRKFDSTYKYNGANVHFYYKKHMFGDMTKTVNQS